MRPVVPRLKLGVAGLALLALGGCAQHPFTTQGEKIYSLYNIVLMLSLVIGVGVIGMIMLTVVRYRKKPGDDTLPPQTHGNTTFEVIWTAIPTIIVLALFAMSFTTIRAIDTVADRPAARIEVRGYQWFWTFDYGTNAAGTRVIVTPDPKKPAEYPVMWVPVGEPIHVEERSDNVIHSWFVPAFLFKRDVVPGRANGFDFTVSSPGIYTGHCAELCGFNHAKMLFSVKAVERADFDAWFNSFKPPTPKCETPGTPSGTVTIHSVPGQIKFEEQCVHVKAGAPSKIEFVHGGGQPHNVAVARDFPPSDIVVGLPADKVITSGTATYAVPALTKGTYFFFCQVHPTMQGVYEVE